MLNYFVGALLLLWPWIESIQGYIYADEGTKIITNFAAVAIILIALIEMLLRGIPRKKLLLLLVLVASLFLWLALRIVFQDAGAIEIAFELSPIVRGAFLFAVLLIYFDSIKPMLREKIVYWYAMYTWGIIGVMIALSAITGIGLKTYSAFESGYKFYFTANNELTFVYSLSFLTVFFLSGRLMKCVSMVIAVAIMLLIGTKGGFVVIALTFYIILFRMLCSIENAWIKAISILFALFPLLLLVTFSDEAADFFVKNVLVYGEGASKLAAKISYLGIWGALLSERDVLAQTGINAVFAGGDISVFIGRGFFEYANSFYTWNALRFAEIDIVDIFGGWGGGGVLLYLWFIVWVFRLGWNTNKLKTSLANVIVAGWTCLAILGNLAGHVILFSYPMLFLSVVLSLRAR